MGNFPQSLADLEFKDASSEVVNLNDGSFRKILHRHYKDKNFSDMQRKIAEEYQNLQEAAFQMGEAEAAYHKIMLARQKLVDVYRDLVIKSQSDAPPKYNKRDY